MSTSDENQKLWEAEFDGLLNSVGNDTPLLLFPVRLETHFRKVKPREEEEQDGLLKILERFETLMDELNGHKDEKEYNFVPFVAGIQEAIEVAETLPADVLVELASLNETISRDFLWPRDYPKYSRYTASIHQALSNATKDKATKQAILAASRAGSSASAYELIQGTTPAGSAGSPIAAVAAGRAQSAVRNRIEAARIKVVRPVKPVRPIKPKLQKELCVRIFPDEIALDYLTDSLTKQEIGDGKSFWLQWFIASGSRKREYEAWQVLCAKYPVHRAAWIVRRLKPANINDFKLGNKLSYRRSYPGIHTIESCCEEIYRNLSKITLDETKARSRFKGKLVQTGKYENEEEIRNLTKALQSCLTRINSNLMSRQYIVDYLFDDIQSAADYLARRLDTIIAFYDKHPSFYGTTARLKELWDIDRALLITLRQEAREFLKNIASRRISLDDMIQEYLKDPQFDFFPSISINVSQKPDMPVANILPDRFMFIGEVKGKENEPIFRYGRRVKQNLQIGLDPNEDMEANPYNITSKGDLEVNGGLAWMVDYDKAEQAGMAITVPLDNAVAEFNYIYVLGLKDSEGKEREYLQSLFDSHNYTTSGLEMLRTGTPTNIVEGGAPAFDSDPDLEMERRYRIEVEEAYNTPRNKNFDSRVLSDVLNLSYEACWGRTVNYDNQELENARVANEALWKHFRQNIVTDDPPLSNLLDFVGDFVINHVKARGVLPSLRIGNQPYGILPTTDFLQLEANLGEKEMPYLKRLNDLLIKLATEWKGIRKQSVVCSETLSTLGSDADKAYLSMAGLTPHSTTFYKRTMIDSPLLPERDATVPSSYLSPLDKRRFFDSLPVDGTEYEVSLSELIEVVKRSLPNLSHEQAGRLASEFLDLFTYRLDAWFVGILDCFLRIPGVKCNTPKIGAFGWVFNLKENPRVPIANRTEVIEKMQLTPKNEADDLQIYKNAGDDRGEYIVAPSIQHAISAAVLRSAYLRTKKDATDSHMCVNLSSMRARQALRMIDGIRSGMSTGIILGADLERYLHEAYRSGPEMDRYVYPLRKMFPQTIDLKAEDSRAQDYVMEVINGEALLNTFMNKWDNAEPVSVWLARPENTPKWFGEFDKETKIGLQPGHKECLFKLIERIMDSYDALSDLLLAEGVHRLIQGDRASYSAISNFMAEGKGNLPDPAILDTPMEYVVVSHKAGIAFPSCDAPPARPMCLAEPAVNRWLEELMEGMERIWFSVGRTDAAGVTTYSRCTLQELEVTPIEYLYLSSNGNVFHTYLEARWRLKNTCFADKVTVYASEPGLNNAGDIYDIDADRDAEGRFNLYENELRINRLRSVILQGRSMKANDWMSAANSDAEDERAVDASDLQRRYASLRACLSQLEAEMTACMEGLGTEACSDDTLAGMYALLCRCMESGMVNSLPAYTPGMFLYRVDPGSGQTVYRIHPVLQRPAFDKAVEMQKAFVEAFANTREELRERIADAEKIVPGAGGEAYTSSQYAQAMQKLLMDTFKLFPRFTLQHALTAEQRKNYDAVIKQGLGYYTNMNRVDFEAWQSDVAEVREGMKLWHHATMFQTMCDGPTGEVSILQLADKGDTSLRKWLGGKVEAESELHDADSLVVYNSGGLGRFDCGQEASFNAGIIIDGWPEFIPYKKQTAGMVFHCDQPDNEAPQALLLAVHPEFNIRTGAKIWRLQHIRQLLDTTRFMLMNRAVEPDMIYQHPSMSKLFPLLNSMRIFHNTGSARSTWSSGKYMGPGTIFRYIPGGHNIYE